MMVGQKINDWTDTSFSQPSQRCLEEAALQELSASQAASEATYQSSCLRAQHIMEQHTLLTSLRKASYLPVAWCSEHACELFAFQDLTAGAANADQAEDGGTIHREHDST